jgi:ketosteroid isomerase-like protein
MASPEQVQAVADMHRTFTERDVPAFITYLTEDVTLRPSTLIAGREEYHGIEDVKRGFQELRALLDSRGEDVTVEPLRFYVDRADDELVVSVARITVTRPDENPYSTDLLYIWRMDGEKVAELDASFDVETGMKQLADPEEVEPGPSAR